MPDPRLELQRITATEWLILDHRYGRNDARRTIACVYALDENRVRVTWLRELPLASCYQTAFDVLEDVQRFYASDHSQRPTRSSAMMATA
ncbi:MAG: hypothetical protein KDB08_02115 [Microthrixaceae bacterium]|nr:hypothetical protein [Microthrixaceae bacterium]